jgi:hypothetical protein
VRIADRVAHLLIADGVESVVWGDGVLAEAACQHGTKHVHPLDRIQAAINSCEQAPDLFRKTRIHGHDSRGRPRITRCFWLIGEPRPLPVSSE